MKCIKTIKKTNSREIGEVIRTEEKEAESKVKTGFWSYCPKSEWKAYNGKSVKTDQVSDEITTKRGKRSKKSDDK